MSLSTSGYLPYNKLELIAKINAINIYKQGTQVITKYFDRVVNTSNVSNLYEIFDIRSFMIAKLEQLETNFKISHYRLKLKGGIQELNLLSDSVEINSTPYYKAFFILNSSDKSRRLNMNLGLYRADNDSYMVSAIKNMSLCKKHLRGITQQAEDVSQVINMETFDEQIAGIQSLIGERVLLSKVRDILIDKDLKINHQRFDAFKNQLRWSKTDKASLSKEQINTLMTPSERLIFNYQNDFSIEAYKVFNCYLQVFSRQDSYVIKRETERILQITQCFIRDEKINAILDLI